MKVQELVAPITRQSPLFEALRMTSEMKNLAQASASEFRFGIEYEFHVDPDHLEQPGPGGMTREEQFDAGFERARMELTSDFLNLTGAFEVIDDNIPRDFFTTIDIEEFLNDQFTQDNVIEKLTVLYKSLIGPSTPRMAFGSIPDAIKEESSINFSLLEDFIFDELHSSELRAPLFRTQDVEQLANYIRTNGSQINDVVKQVYDNNLDGLGDEEMAEVLANEVLAEYQNSFVVDAYIRDHIPDSGDDDDDEDNDDLRIDFIREKLSEMDIEHHIENVVLDGSVSEGVEVITKPLPLRQTIEVMRSVFDIIDDYGRTSDRTGMHVNISHASFSRAAEIDPLKVTALMDVEYFQGRSDGGIVKYDMRNEMVRSTFYEINDQMLVDIALGYVREGVEGMEEVMRRKLIGSGTKFRDINWTSLLGNFEPNSRRIEFRFFGGRNYEDRLTEITQDLMYIMAVVKSVTDNSFKPRDYYRGLIRILDRATKRMNQMHRDYFPYQSFTDVIQDVRSGELF